MKQSTKKFIGLFLCLTQIVLSSTFAAQMNKMYIEADQSNTDYSISAYLLNDNERINHLTPIK